ncbi:uncharacterized protein LOC106650133 [Trichogramma pretiosum]|uniref:uncharacterized protein LOC106650133 n=1 Tax=Trichogramma pretiosum TaxID=7493 RepID=UPI0006C98FB7|nr:uncharacterized protein LOC106650133 [Trichogramma pretiosum]
MDYTQVLTLLTKLNEDDKASITNDVLEDIMKKVHQIMPEDVIDNVSKNRHEVLARDDVAWVYLHTILFVVSDFAKTELSQENPLFTIEQMKILRNSIKLASHLGIVSSFHSAIKVRTRATDFKNFQIHFEHKDIFDKYKIMCHTVTLLLELFEHVILRSAVISQLDSILAALFQLSFAPLQKPIVDSPLSENNNAEFKMTTELYANLIKDQVNYQNKLYELKEKMPLTSVLTNIMMISAESNNPRWFQINVHRYISEIFMMSNGVVSLTTVICDELTDVSVYWPKLNVAGEILIRRYKKGDTGYTVPALKYYDAICSQLITLLESKEYKQGAIIANCYIKVLYEFDKDLCQQKVLDIIMNPLHNKNNKSITTENQVSQCIENLCKLFITTRAEFTCLPLTILSSVLQPLFYLYLKVKSSIYVHRNKVKELLLKILQDVKIRHPAFSVILNHDMFAIREYGERLNFKFGDDGGLMVSSEPFEVENDEIAGGLYELVKKDDQLAFSLFEYLLKVSPNLNHTADEAAKNKKLLQSPKDIIEKMEKQLIVIQLLSMLSDLPNVQKAQMRSPQSLLGFIKFYFTKISSTDSISNDSHEQDVEILYTCLMLIKQMIIENKETQSWKAFEDFISDIRTINFKNIPEKIVSIFEEIEKVIRKKGKESVKHYYDLSAENKLLNEVDKALADLTDPLLPVRGHGLITLTKLIEARHPETELKKDLLFCIFQQNLTHEDSFIYLASINGICAMTKMFPDKVIETLVQEFIGLTQQQRNCETTPETRAKLGEILVKTTRALGEMTPKYKSLLVNGFLCGTKDPDAMVRASSLSCLGEFCKIMGFRLGNLMIEILYCISCIIKTDKDDSCRRAAVLVTTLLLQGLGKSALVDLGENLVPLYRSLKHLRDTDNDPTVQLHAQLALEEFDDIVKHYLFAPPKLEKTIFLLSNN